MKIWVYCLRQLQMIRSEAAWFLQVYRHQNIINIATKGNVVWIMNVYENSIFIDANMNVTSPIIIYMDGNISHLFVEYESYGHKRFRMTTLPPWGISLAVEGWAWCGCQLHIPKANTNIARVNLQYISAFHPRWASPPIKNETTAFMTDWEVTEVASCHDEGVLFTLGCCQTTTKFITSSQGPLGPSHSATLINGSADQILK